MDIRSYPKSKLANDDDAENLRKLTGELCDFNSETWRAKKEKGLSLNAEIDGVSVPDVLSEFSAELTAMHKLI